MATTSCRENRVHSACCPARASQPGGRNSGNTGQSSHRLQSTHAVCVRAQQARRANHTGKTSADNKSCSYLRKFKQAQTPGTSEEGTNWAKLT